MNMLNQYRAQRRMGGHNPRGIGTVAVGTIVYLQDGISPFGGFRAKPIKINPWMVTAWMNREIGAARKGADGRYENTFAVGGHLATVQSLRDGRTQTVADWIILACVDAGLTQTWRIHRPKRGTARVLPAPRRMLELATV